MRVNVSEYSEVWVMLNQRWLRLLSDGDFINDFASYAELLIDQFRFEAVELRKVETQTMWSR
jgi:hypothetical protein